MKKFYAFIIAFALAISLSNVIDASAASESKVNKKVIVSMSPTAFNMASYFDSYLLPIYVENNTSKPIYIQKKATYYDDDNYNFNRDLKLEKGSYVKIAKKSGTAINYNSSRPLTVDFDYGYIEVKYKYAKNSKGTKVFTQYAGFDWL